MIETIYLQKETKGKIALAVKVQNKTEEFPYDYYTLEILSNELTIKELNNLVVEKYNCRKLIIQF